MAQVLHGLRVLDLTQNVAGPYCTQILGDMGAQVIKVERPGSGDDTRAWLPPAWAGQSSTFLALNRNKLSICVDLDCAEGQALMARLAADADVFIHSMKPGSAEARGLGAASLRAANPRLVYCAISAFGQTGPLRGLPGYDPLMQAYTGIMSVTGNEGDDPVRVSVSLIDMGSGMWAAMGILAALRELERTTSPRAFATRRRPRGASRTPASCRCSTSARRPTSRSSRWSSSKATRWRTTSATRCASPTRTSPASTSPRVCRSSIASATTSSRSPWVGSTSTRRRPRLLLRPSPTRVDDPIVNRAAEPDADQGR